jgi:cytochrome c-type biogenesis protein CcmE
MSPKAKQRSIRLVLILSFIIGICVFLAGALRENIVYFKTPSELLTLTDLQKKLRLGGVVVKGSVKSANGNHTFTITDRTTSIQVEFVGRLPDLFREGQAVVAIGTYGPHRKVFIANQLLAKHDQYYRPK